MHARRGGALYIYHGSVTFIGTAFVGGTSLQGGGALFADEVAQVTLQNCTLRGCSTDSFDAGAVLLHGMAQLSLVQCSVSICHAAGAGVAIACHGNSSVLVQSCHLQHNTCNTTGGAVHLGMAASLEASECSIVDNACNWSGGGVSASGDASFRSQGCIVDGNSVDPGGGLWLQDRASMQLFSTQVENNIAHTAAVVRWWEVAISWSFLVLPAQLYAAVQNNMAPVGPDLNALPTTIPSSNVS
jgi:hypothetical protein